MFFAYAYGKNSHHFNLNTDSNKRFCPGCSHGRPGTQGRAAPRWPATSHTIVDHFLVVPCLSCGINEAQLGICADTYLVGVTLPLSCSNVGSSGYMQQQDMEHYVERAEAEGLLMLLYCWPEVWKRHRCQWPQGSPSPPHLAIWYQGCVCIRVTNL